MKAVIMAGGSGTRLWPVSRKNSPKQSQPFGDNETLLQKTFRRLRRSWPVSDIFISTSVDQFPALKKQLPGVSRAQYVLETARRETAPAIGLAAAYLHKRWPTETMFTANSDAYIKEPDVYAAMIKAAGDTVRQYPDHTVLLGIKPRYPDTGLGYIKMKKQIATVRSQDVFLVDRFVEKPTMAKAVQYTQSWQYLWNPAMFVFRVDAFLHKFKEYMPASYRLLMKMQAAMGTSREAATIKQLYPKMEKISIDYAVMERDPKMLVIPVDFTWSDIGSWRAVFDMLAEHPQANLLRGRHVTVDSQGNLLFSYSNKLIATAGLHDMIVIEADDAILVCPKDRAQDVKKIVAELERRKLTRHL